MKRILGMLVVVILSTLLFGCDSFTETIQQVTPDSAFEIHYIDVGQGDSILILCDEEVMLIDGGNVADSSLIVAYLKKLSIHHIDFMVCTHAHEDHVGGLSGPLNVYTVGKVYAPKTGSDSKAYMNFIKAIDEQGLEITIPYIGESIRLGSSSAQFLGPLTEDSSDINNTSIVLKITYGETSFLFMGDATKEVETEMLSQGYDLDSTVLKAGHHGSEYSSSYIFLREVMPEYAIISAGSGNVYGHPDENTLSRFRDAQTKVYRTDLQGDIILKSDGKILNFTTERNSSIQTNPTQNPVSQKPNSQFIGNENSQKLHLSNCSFLPDEGNRVYFKTKQDAMDNGYDACKNCNP